MVVHTPGTKHLCTFDMELCRGDGKLYYSRLVTPHECDLPRLYKSGSDFGRNNPMWAFGGGSVPGGVLEEGNSAHIIQTCELL